MLLRSLRAQILLLALLPPFLVALGLGSFLSYSRTVDIEEFANARAGALINQLALAVDFAETHEDTEALQTMLNAALEETGLRSISIFDPDGQALAQSGVQLARFIDPASYLDLQAHKIVADGLHVFIRPMQTDPIADTPRGWIALAYQQDIFVVKRYQSYLTQNGILLVLLVLAGLFGLWLGQKLIRDVRSINNHVKRIAEGDHIETIPVDSCNEMQILARNIHYMARTLQAELDELQQSVNITTGDLKETIETIEIKNIELNLAQKEAQAASRIKSEFLANTSHEIRTPLNGIIGFTKILKRTPLNAQQAEYLETIQQSSQGLMAIINDILDFSKIEAGKLELEESLFNLQQTCEEVISLFAASCYEKNIELVLLLYKDVPVHLIGDAMRIKQLLSNLLNNAIKFTQSGTIAIRVAVEDGDTQHALISFAVSDTGIGMSEEQQKSLFQAFAQGNTSISREYGGTGLGLAIVKKLADLMQGDIKVQSSLHEGSAFTLSLRLKMANQPQNQESTPLQGKSILVHDPHPLAGLACQSLLQGMGCSVQLAENPDRARQTLQFFAVDALVCSMSPQEQLAAFIEQAQQLQQQADCPLLLLLPPGHEKYLDTLPQVNTAVSLKPVIEPKLYQALAGLLHHDPQGKTHTEIKNNIDNRHILAVDDQPANLKLLQVLLEDIGAQVSTANNGAKAIELCRQQHFDLILMDIQMPNISGVQATETIRQEPGLNKKTPIIAITAHAMADERRALLQAGMNDYISKPVNETQLLALLDTWCEAKTPTYPPAVDPGLCLQLAGGKKSLAADMFIMLTDELANSLADIHAHYNAGNYQDMLEAIHKLHGACCYTGVPQLKAITTTLETRLKAGDIIDTALLEKLGNAAAAILTWHRENTIDEILSEH